MIGDVVSLVLSVLALVWARQILAIGAGNLDCRGLQRQRRGALVVAVGALLVFVARPVVALAIAPFAPLPGAHLAVVMALGFVQLGVLAIEIAILHQVRVAREALS